MSQYMEINDLVEKVDVRNSDEAVTELIGLSIDKCFIKSVANTIGTDLSKYKVIRKNQFAVSLMQVSRDEKIPVACLKNYESAIMSPAYSIFQVKDENFILADYLDLWFKRSEFDREAAFIAVGGVRGSMPFEEFGRIKVLVPSIEEQQKIVDAYNTIQTRIELKKKINENLVAQAQAYFGAIFIGKDTEDSLPDGWEIATVGDYCVDNIANLSKNDGFDSISYLDTGSITDNYIVELQELSLFTDEIPSRAKRKAFHGDIVYSTVRPNLRHYGLLQNPPENLIVSTGFAVLHNKGYKVTNELLFMWLTKDSVLEYLQAIAENSVSTYPSLNVSDLLTVKIVVPDDVTLEKLNRFLGIVFSTIADNNKHIQMLLNSSGILLSKLISGR